MSSKNGIQDRQRLFRQSLVLVAAEPDLEIDLTEPAGDHVKVAA